MGMTRTLEQFESEWYELKTSGQLPADVGQVPDTYVHTRVLEDEVAILRREVEEAKVCEGRSPHLWSPYQLGGHRFQEVGRLGPHLLDCLYASPRLRSITCSWDPCVRE